ncbi:hypothetical protein BDV93DRAFT_366874 [Ceratobasidium sp. AG-I]|nr:hypothetical protein BDV93DRAFT_366874 [Ceratobasidium sp. AG-I]
MQTTPGGHPSLKFSPSLEANETSFHSVFDEWKTSHTLLKNAIQRHLSACSALGALCVQSDLEESFVNSALTEIDGDILAIPSMDEMLHRAQAHLLFAKNASRPVNRLPAEILGYILALSKTQCTRDLQLGVCQMDTTSVVCVHWRNIALNTPYMWSHIDVSRDPRCLKDMLLLLERSRKSLIHVHLYEPETSSYIPLNPINLMQHLIPHMDRIASLDIGVSYGSRVLFNSWLNNGSPNSTRSLVINRHLDESLIILDEEYMDLNLYEIEHYSQILLSLRILCLRNAMFAWDSPAYCGLVDLRLDFTQLRSNPSISQSALACILASSPGLVILKVKHLVVTPSPGWDQPTITRLDCLEVLNLVEDSPGCVSLLLPLIAPPQRTGYLSVGIIIHTTKRSTLALKDFFGRSCITTLSLAQYSVSSKIKRVMPLLVNLTKLERLILSAYVDPPSSGSVLSAASSIQPYHLKELYLVSCATSLETIVSLLLAYKSRTLYLHDCDIRGEGVYLNSEQIENTLLQTFPALDCIFLSEDITAKWPCCAMLDD